jgi:hypothetical protein
VRMEGEEVKGKKSYPIVERWKVPAKVTSSTQKVGTVGAEVLLLLKAPAVRVTIPALIV